ncbi:E3 ubiquitin-protein ligase rad18 [Gonapodya sp. JEL0774]|nr:E3 ubiquitin-protein ligase rad18 [Gonapodya sp. JEL0774]
MYNARPPPAKRRRLSGFNNCSDDQLAASQPRCVGQLDLLLQCPVCTGPYSEYPPLTASGCGHVACSLCVRRHVAERGECVACRQSTLESSLKVDRALADVAQAWWGSGRKEVMAMAATAQELVAALEQEREKSSSNVNSPAPHAPSGIADVIDLNASGKKAVEEPIQPLRPSDKVSCPLCTSLVRFARLNAHIDAGCLPSPPDLHALVPTKELSGWPRFFKRDVTPSGSETAAGGTVTGKSSIGEQPAAIPPAQIKRKSNPTTVSTTSAPTFRIHTSAPNRDSDDNTPFDVDSASHSPHSPNHLQHCVAPPQTCVVDVDSLGLSSPSQSHRPSPASSTRPTSSYFSNSRPAPVPPRRLPPPVLSLLTAPQLRAHLRRHGLPLDGTKSQQGRRLVEFVTRWNAECDRGVHRGRRKLVEEVSAWERAISASSGGGASGNAGVGASSGVCATAGVIQSAGQEGNGPDPGTTLVAISTFNRNRERALMDPRSAQFDAALWMHTYKEEFEELVEKARQTFVQGKASTQSGSTTKYKERANDGTRGKLGEPAGNEYVDETIMRKSSDVLDGRHHPGVSEESISLDMHEDLKEGKMEGEDESEYGDENGANESNGLDQVDFGEDTAENRDGTCEEVCTEDETTDGCDSSDNYPKGDGENDEVMSDQDEGAEGPAFGGQGRSFSKWRPDEDDDIQGNAGEWSLSGRATVGIGHGFNADVDGIENTSGAFNGSGRWDSAARPRVLEESQLCNANSAGAGRFVGAVGGPGSRVHESLGITVANHSERGLAFKDKIRKSFFGVG